MQPNKGVDLTVMTRKGTFEPLDISIVRKRLEELSFGLNLQFVNLDLVVQKVEMGVHDRITTAQLDNLAAETCAYMVIIKLLRILCIRIIAFWRHESPLIISARKPKIRSKMLPFSSTTARINAIDRLLSFPNLFTISSSNTTKNSIKSSIFQGISTMTSLASKPWRDPIF